MISLAANQIMWTAFIIGSSSPIIFFLLYKMGYVSKKIITLFIIGICVGLTWEIPFALAGDSFHLILVDWPIDLPLVRNINYAFLDSLIFLIGIFLCNTILKSDSYLYTFNSNALLIMIIWGSISEFLVDLNCSGKLNILKNQKVDLSLSFDQLLQDYKSGVKKMKVYRQMKMYNDSTLNPELYQKNNS